MNDFRLKIENIQSKEKSTNSLLAAHLAMIAGEPKESHAIEEAEVEQARYLKWPHLNLVKPQQRQRFWNRNYIFGSMVALAAAIALMVFVQPRSDDASIKGSTKIFVLWEHEGETKILNDYKSLTANDRINIEIIAGEPLIAFMGVFNRYGNGLSELHSIELNALRLASGVRAHFDTAIELTTENDGEELLVVACQRDAFRQKFPNTTEFAKIFYKMKPDASLMATIAKICQTQFVRLRD